MFASHKAAWGLAALLLAFLWACQSTGSIKTENKTPARPASPETEPTPSADLATLLPLQPRPLPAQARLFSGTEGSPARSITPRSPEKSSRRPVSYSGDRFIRELKFHPYTGQVTEILSIQGNSRVSQGSVHIAAITLETIGESGDVIISPGQLNLSDEKQQTRLSARYGEYHKSSQIVFLRDRVKIVQKSPKTGENTTLRCDEAEHSFPERISHVYGNVMVDDPDYVAFSQKGTYDQNSDEIMLEQDPFIYQGENIFQADQMNLERHSGRAILSGRVKMWITEKDKQPPPGSEQGKVENIISADLAIYEKIAGPAGSKVTLSGQQVVLERPDSVSLARQVEVWGEDAREAEASGDVRYYSQGEKHRIFSENARYTRKSERVLFRTLRSLRPVMYFYDENRRPSGSLEADTIERFSGQKKVQARGNVLIRIFEPSENDPGSLTLQSSLQGSWAEYKDEEKILYLFGNPSVDSQGDRIYARKILVYPEKRELELQGQLRGQLSH